MVAEEKPTARKARRSTAKNSTTSRAKEGSLIQGDQIQDKNSSKAKDSVKVGDCEPKDLQLSWILLTAVSVENKI